MDTNRQRIPTSETGIRNLKKPAKQIRLSHKERDTPLVLLLSPGGTKTFQFYMTVKGEQHQRKIGTWPDVNLVEAIDKSRAMRKAALNGKAIQPTSDVQQWTVQQTFDDYLRVTPVTEATAREYHCYLTRLDWDSRLMTSFEDPREFENKAIDLREHEESNHNIFKAFDRLSMVAKHWNARLPRGVEKFSIEAVQLARKQARYRIKSHPAFKREADWATSVALAQAAYAKTPVIATHWLMCAFTGLRTWSELAALRWDMVKDLEGDTPHIDFAANAMKIRGLKRADAKMRPDVFRKFLNPLAADALKRWAYDSRRERYMLDARRAFVFPSRNSAGKHITGSSELLKVVVAELGDRVVYYSLRRFFVNQAARCDLETKYRLGLVDHSTGELNTSDDTYGDIYDKHLYPAEIKVGKRLKKVLKKSGVALSVS